MPSTISSTVQPIASASSRGVGERPRAWVSSAVVLLIWILSSWSRRGTRIDLRLHMLFWELADRWGTVRQDGVHVPLYLTHSMLADLVAARRPTVTKALGELADRSTVIWTGDDWLLPGDPPDELDSVASVRVPAAIQ